MNLRLTSCTPLYRSSVIVVRVELGKPIAGSGTSAVVQMTDILASSDSTNILAKGMSNSSVRLLVSKYQK